VSAALAAKRKFPGERGVEHDDRFGGERPVLRRAERQDVDACPPGRLGRCAPEPHDRVRKARPVHVDLQSEAVRLRSERGKRLGRVDRSPLGRLRDGDGGGLHVVDPHRTDESHGLGELLRPQASVARGQAQELGAPA